MRSLALMTLLLSAASRAEENDADFGAKWPKAAGAEEAAPETPRARRALRAPCEAPCEEATSRETQAERDDDNSQRIFAGVRMGASIPPGGSGVAPELAIELGVARKHGFGYGIHLLSMYNPPAVPALNIAKAVWGVGALADVRIYFQSVDPLTLYCTLSAGFVAGPSNGISGNAVLPLLNPGFGARIKPSDNVYIAFEFGLASFFIPFVTLSFGWEPTAKHG